MDQPVKFEVPILWDIMEEYVDEAEFGFERFQSACVDPEYVLHEVAQGPEEKILACVDGLVIAGERVIDRLLQPELESISDPDLEQERALAILFSLLMMGKRETVRVCLAGDEPVQRKAAIDACGFYPGHELDDWLSGELGSVQNPGHRGALLEALAQRRVEGDGWKESIKAQDPRELRGALLAMRYADPRGFVPTVEALAHPEAGLSPDLRWQAVLTALYAGSQRAWMWLQQIAFAEESGPWSQTAMSLVAGLGTAKERSRIEAALQVPEFSERALRALGCSGQTRFVQPLLVFAGQDDCEVRLAKLAGEAIALISGLPWYEDAYQVEVPADDPDEELVQATEDVDSEALLYDPVEDLPVPNLGAVAQWCQEKKVMTGDRRLIMGREWGPAAMSEFMEQAPMRWRGNAALELAMRTRGLVCVPTGALSRVQQRYMAQIAGLDARLFSMRLF